MPKTRTRTTLRTEAVTSRYTPAEVALLEATAAAMGLTRSSAVRQLVLQAAREQLTAGLIGDTA